MTDSETTSNPEHMISRDCSPTPPPKQLITLPVHPSNPPVRRSRIRRLGHRRVVAVRLATGVGILAMRVLVVHIDSQLVASLVCVPSVPILDGLGVLPNVVAQLRKRGGGDDQGRLGHA